MILRSIKLKVTFILLIGISIISVFFAIHSYQSNMNTFETDLENSADRIIVRLTQTLQLPLWELDNNWVKTVLQTEMANEKICAILVEGEGDIQIAISRDEEWNAVFSKGKLQKGSTAYAHIGRFKTVVHDGKEIGKVKLYLTKRFLNEYLLNNALELSMSTGMMILFLIMALFLILDMYVLNPIEKILNVVRAVTTGKKQKINLKQDDEIGELARGFDRMIQSVQNKEDMMIAQSRHAAMGEMISMIAHQWRQPITVIAMNANNLLADIELEAITDENVKKNAQKTLEQTQHLSQTIDDFKNFFRPNKEAESVSVNDMLEESFTIIGKSLENNGIEVVKNYQSQNKVTIYSRELLQVLINIIKNAKEALVEKNIKEPIISIGTDEDNESVLIEICDNGEGINEEIIKKIYDPYFTTKDEKVGTGLGLYISKTIVEKHLKGILKAENCKEGGVCFTITIPKTGV